MSKRPGQKRLALTLDGDTCRRLRLLSVETRGNASRPDRATASSKMEQNRTESPIPPKGAGVESDRFEEFWTVYPHRKGEKKGKKTAKTKWGRLRKAAISHQTMIDGSRAAQGMDDVKRGFARDPTTWLNQEGWMDEPKVTGNSDNGPMPHYQRILKAEETERANSCAIGKSPMLTRTGTTSPVIAISSKKP